MKTGCRLLAYRARHRLNISALIVGVRRRERMSASGTKQICSMRRRMSAFSDKADKDPLLTNLDL